MDSQGSAMATSSTASTRKFERNPPNDYPMQLKIALQQVPLIGLPQEARELLSNSLNTLTILPTESGGVIRDFRGLADSIGFEYSVIYRLSKEKDPMKELLEIWRKKRGATIGKLMEVLEKMERFDVLDDLKIIFMKHLCSFIDFISSKEPYEPEHKEMEAKAEAFGLRYLSRPSWGACYSLQNTSLTTQPVRLVFIHHTVSRGKDDMEVVRKIQLSKMLIYGHDDVVSNMMVGNDGTIYEGRGWDYAGSHTRRYNFISMSIGLVGNYEEDRPNPRMIAAAQKIIEFGVHLGKIDPNYGLYAHCDASETQSPGKYVLELMPSWPRYHEFGPLPSPEEITSDSFFSEFSSKLHISR